MRTASGCAVFWLAASLACLVRGGPEPALAPVPFTTGVSAFKPGDGITITNVRSTSPDMKPGDTVAVDGTYSLASAQQAMVGLSVTFTRSQFVQTNSVLVRISGPAGTFSLTRPIEAEGYLNVRLVSEGGGPALGRIYFGTATQMQEIQHWDPEKWLERK